MAPRCRRGRERVLLDWAMTQVNLGLEDLRPQDAGWQVRLHEKGGKQHAVPSRPRRGVARLHRRRRSER